jgi:hypothetical protein
VNSLKVSVFSPTVSTGIGSGGLVRGLFLMCALKGLFNGKDVFSRINTDVSAWCHHGAGAPW